MKTLYDRMLRFITLAAATAIAAAVAANSASNQFERILKMISSYEIESHLDIVLLGTEFDQSSIDNVGESLEKLAIKARALSPFSYLREYTQFHVYRDSRLEKSLYNYANSLTTDEICPREMEKILSSHHQKSASSTTLFVLYKVFRDQDKYPSTSTPPCHQRAFLSREDFAWIDLTVSAETIEPRLDIDSLQYPEFSMSDSYNKWHKLASIIYHSMEALIPLPYSSNSQVSSALPPPPSSMKLHITTTSIHILVIGLCIDAFGSDPPVGTAGNSKSSTNFCSGADHHSTIDTIESFVKSSTSSSVELSFTVRDYNLSDHPLLLHAFFHSLVDEDPADIKPQQRKLFKISSSELLFWLGSSRTMRDLMEKNIASAYASMDAEEEGGEEKGDGEDEEEEEDKAKGDIKDKADSSDHRGKKRRIILPLFFIQNPVTSQGYYLDHIATYALAGKFPVPPDSSSFRKGGGEGGGDETPEQQAKEQEPDEMWNEVSQLRAGLSNQLSFTDEQTPLIQWPSTAIVVMRNNIGAEFAEQNVFNSELHCGHRDDHVRRGSDGLGKGDLKHKVEAQGQLLTVGSWHKEELLFYTLRQVIFNVPPPYVHYSSLSMRRVVDFLWVNSPAQCGPGPSHLSINKASSTPKDASSKVSEIAVTGCVGFSSFRERRAIIRMEFFSRAERLLHALYSTLAALQIQAPELDVSNLLSEEWAQLEKMKQGMLLRINKAKSRNKGKMEFASSSDVVAPTKAAANKDFGTLSSKKLDESLAKKLRSASGMILSFCS